MKIDKLSDNKFKVYFLDKEQIFTGVELVKYFIEQGYTKDDVIEFGVSEEDFREITILQVLNYIP